MADVEIDRLVVLRGKDNISASMACLGMGSAELNLKLALFCADHQEINRNIAFSGKHEIERGVALKGNHQIKTRMAIRSEDNQYPVIETDPLSLRNSSVYESPGSLFTLQIPYGDWSRGTASVPLQLIDQDTSLYHLSDFPIRRFVRVLKDGVPLKTGFRTYVSYTDSTGRQISAVRFNARQSGNLSAQIEGVAFPDGSLIKNPGDIAYHVMEQVQQYSWAFINHVRMGIYRSECLTENLELRILLNKSNMTFKTFFSILGACTNAVHTSDSGHALVRRKGLI